MKNYRIIDSCRTCRYCVGEEVNEQFGITFMYFCNKDFDKLKNPLGGSSIVELNKITEWQEQHKVDCNGICDCYCH